MVTALPASDVIQHLNHKTNAEKLIDYFCPCGPYTLQRHLRVLVEDALEMLWLAL
jgi:predicted ThiF/HesA family dinucleotide-utilizing enzyme